MEKMIEIDYDKCIGCRTCETVCSLTHEERINPAEARINIVKYEEIGTNIPMLCQKCEEPECVAACPMNAITIDESLGAQIDHSRCIGCKMCIMACPIGGISLNPTNKEIIMCDLCQGDPECVRSCPEEALEYIDISKLSLKKRREGVKKLATTLEEIKI